MERRGDGKAGRWPRAAALGVAAALAGMAGAAGLLAGCGGGGMDTGVMRQVEMGEFGLARARLARGLPAGRGDKTYLLERVKLGIVTSADGLPAAGERTMAEVYDVLRTQGINADRALGAVVLNEGVRFWKGEPFEQAMSFAYVSLQYGMLAEWGNMRAAANDSLFRLQDFKENERTQEALRARDAARAAAEARSSAAPDGTPADAGYVTTTTDFALGYLLSGVASRGLGREEEAADNFAAAVRARPELGPVVETLRGDGWNTLLVVEYGLGPQKISYGDDGAYTTFRPFARFAGPIGALRVAVREGDAAAGEGAEWTVPPAADLNRMASENKWRNLQDVRVAKSLVGTGLLVGGGVTAAAGGNTETQLIGLGIAGLGLLAKLGAQADTTYCELLPQRVYVAPVMVRSAGTSVALQLADERGARLLLTDLAPPAAPERLAVRHVRMPSMDGGLDGRWVTAGRTVYSNDVADADEGVGGVGGAGGAMPYILGGRCVRRPSAETMARYHAAGNLRELTTADLENLYRAEGISWDQAELGPGELHVLEGGRSLATPLAGTAGYQRVFGQEHGPYAPRSRELKEAAERYGVRAAPASPGGGGVGGGRAMR